MNPEIEIRDGFTIGYRHRDRFGPLVPSPLASVKSGFRLGPGRHLLLARNGRGKTTLLKTLAGLLPRLAGDFAVTGKALFVHEDLSFDPELNAGQIFGSFFGAADQDRARQFAGRLDLDVRKPFGKLSKGNRQKVILILAETFAVGKGPKVLLLDEPFSGLDTFARQAIDAIWEDAGGEVLRLVCVHPDEPTLRARSAVLIRDGAIEQVATGGELDWLKTRECLN